MREFLARKKVAHEFIDVRKAPISADDTVALVRRHKRALAKRGSTMIEVDPEKATDEQIRKLFLGREGTLRAPTISVDDTLIAGFAADVFEAELG